MKTLIYTLVLSFLILNSCLAGTISPNVEDKKHIAYGSEFHHVVRLLVIDTSNRKMVGSAVILNKHWILTAAHVIEDCKSCVVFNKDKKYCLNFIVCHNEFNNNEIGKCDIALGYSEEPFDISFDLELYENNNEISKVCCMSGFGLSGTFNSGAVVSDGNKRGGSNRIKEIFRGLLVCSVTDPKPTSLEFLIASGDSGGGLFIDGKLAGIHSCVLSDDKNGPNSDYGDDSGHTRISDHIVWIKESMVKKEVSSNLAPSE